jgi:hypothetical protein
MYRKNIMHRCTWIANKGLLSPPLFPFFSEQRMRISFICPGTIPLILSPLIIRAGGRWQWNGELNRPDTAYSFTPISMDIVIGLGCISSPASQHSYPPSLNLKLGEKLWDPGIAGVCCKKEWSQTRKDGRNRGRRGSLRSFISVVHPSV